MEDEIEVLNFDVGDISTGSDASVTNGPRRNHPRVTERPAWPAPPSTVSMCLRRCTPGGGGALPLYRRHPPPLTHPGGGASSLTHPEAEQLPAHGGGASAASPFPHPPGGGASSAATTPGRSRSRRRRPRTQRKCHSFSSCGFTACSGAPSSPSCRALL